jgi:FkbM family methyltransferase
MLCRPSAAHPSRRIDKMNNTNFTFREGTCDENVYRSVVELNEYRLPAQIDHALVIDVGTHIGSFAKACLERGAGFIAGFEPQPENATIARGNLASWIDAGQATVRQTAIWRSDRVEYGLFHSGYLQDENELNTGGGDVIGSKGVRVSTVPLDAVIADLIVGHPDGRSVLLKLDCEGSEWPILLTAKRLASVDAICGEYHEIPDGKIPRAAKVKDHLGYSVRVLDFWLTINGFQFEAMPTLETNLGHFWAWRKGAFEFAL